MDETIDAQGARGLDRQIIGYWMRIRSRSSVWRARGITGAMPMEWLGFLYWRVSRHNLSR